MAGAGDGGSSEMEMVPAGTNTGEIFAADRGQSGIPRNGTRGVPPATRTCHTNGPPHGRQRRHLLCRSLLLCRLLTPQETAGDRRRPQGHTEGDRETRWLFHPPADLRVGRAPRQSWPTGASASESSSVVSVEPAHTSADPSVFPSVLGPGPDSVAQGGRVFCSSCRICCRARVERTGGASSLAMWPGPRSGASLQTRGCPWVFCALGGRRARLSAVLVGHLHGLNIGRAMRLR